MSKAMKKLEKQKVRERENRKKLLHVREVRRGIARERRADLASEVALQKMVEQRSEMERFVGVMGEKLPEETRQTILKNIETLRVLEDEYLAEMDAKAVRREELEKEGHTTLPEMIAALGKKHRIDPVLCDESGGETIELSIVPDAE